MPERCGSHLCIKWKHLWVTNESWATYQLCMWVLLSITKPGYGLFVQEGSCDTVTREEGFTFLIWSTSKNNFFLKLRKMETEKSTEWGLSLIASVKIYIYIISFHLVFPLDFFLIADNKQYIRIKITHFLLTLLEIQHSFLVFLSLLIVTCHSVYLCFFLWLKHLNFENLLAKLILQKIWK